MGVNGEEIHYHGQNLRDDITDELGDLLASIYFFMTMNGISDEKVTARMNQKLALYYKWNEENRIRKPEYDRIGL